MAVSVIAQYNPKKWRKIVFGVVTALLGLLFLSVGAFVLLSPWGLVAQPASSAYHPEIHRWHDAVAGALVGIMFAGCLLALVWQGQSKPVLAQFFALCILLFTIAMFAFAPTKLVNSLVPAIMLAVFLLAYPARRDLLTFKRQGLSLPLLALSVVGLAVIAPDIWRNLQLQLTDKASEHAQNLHWISTAVLEVLLVLAGFLAALKRPGWRALGSITGVAFVYLGAAAQAVPYHPGSWGTIGGALALLGGLGYLVTTLLERQATRLEQPATRRQAARVEV